MTQGAAAGKPWDATWLLWNMVVSIGVCLAVYASASVVDALIHGRPVTLANVANTALAEPGFVVLLGALVCLFALTARLPGR
ncbi:hypothetical protein [Catellatospora sichuanensis]|uniref:hypothetical protein n=1 Tax=Catellatospora sichuanensis TaxID=1969805 RepID=UPI001183C1DC|nr:hypothetical protein [Catellatospora sichuanensis]